MEVQNHNRKHAKTVEKSEGTGTDSQQGKMVPTNEEN